MKAAGKVDKAKEAAAAEEEEAKPNSFDKKKKDIWGRAWRIMLATSSSIFHPLVY